MSRANFASRIPPLSSALLTAICLAISFLVSGCSSLSEQELKARLNMPIPQLDVQVLEQDAVRVSLSVLADDGAADFFGVSLAEFGIQLIWMQIENNSDTDFWLLPFALDPDYFSADEVALVAGIDFSRKQRDALRQLLRKHMMPFFLPAHVTQSGYVYASYKRGGRLVDVRLSGYLEAVRLRFAVLLPTESFDYEKSELRELYSRVEQLPDLSESELREKLRELPCCTSSVDGEGIGDPLNVVLIGDGRLLIAALTTSSWNFTEAITVESLRKMIGAAIKELAFPTAPVSALYVFGRKQDIALQRGRSTISQRNHMRLWLAPFRCKGVPVWIGQISRDIGVKVTAKSPTLTTHVIDPLVDEAREYLFHSLLHHDAVSQFAFVRGVGEASEALPRYNLTGDPYFTDGMRMVLWLSREPVPPHMAIDLGWNESADPSREGRGEQYLVPVLSAPEARD